MTEIALSSDVRWVGCCRTKVRVGKKKQEACHDPDIWGERRVAMHHILGGHHHRHSDRRQNCAPSYVLPLKSGR